MNDLTLSAAQADMRRAWYAGAPGVLTSGLVWLAATATAMFRSTDTAVLVLLGGGAMIFPVSMLVTRLLGRSARHEPGNVLGGLAGETTAWLVAGCIIAYGAHILRGNWFFPAMLLVIGARYLAFQTVYGIRLYWLLGAALLAAGMGTALANARDVIAAAAGAGIELAFAAVLFGRARRGDGA